MSTGQVSDHVIEVSDELAEELLSRGFIVVSDETVDADYMMTELGTKFFTDFLNSTYRKLV